MRFASDSHGRKIEVSHSGEEATCPGCGQMVFGRKGRVKAPYWRHASKIDCDQWSEPMSQWHIDWQNEFGSNYCEINLYDEFSGESHRADVRLESGLVLEIQNSPISIDDISKREKFYSRPQMIWILNGERLASKSKLKFRHTKPRNQIVLDIPSYLQQVPDYDFDEFREEILSSKEYRSLYHHPAFESEDIQNGCNITLDFKLDEDLRSLSHYLKYRIDREFRRCFDASVMESISNEFRYRYFHQKKEIFTSIELDRKYWRQLIDYMDAPVYIDRINGLPEGYVYHLQANRIITREELISELKSE